MDSSTAARRADWPLCCTGTYPFFSQVFLLVLELLVALLGAGGADFRALRLLRYLEVVSIGTAIAGIILLKQRAAAKAVPRGCDCCCPCPFPAWSMYAQMIDLLGVILLVLVDPNPVSIVWALVILIAVSLDVAFATIWILALHEQDGDLCCSQGRRGLDSGGLTASPGHVQTNQVVVVGRPVGVQNPHVSGTPLPSQGQEGLETGGMWAQKVA
eukprot:TRINITY_DN9208_c0_g2_i1.p1 TRINITY_DN9208_c0_g2~~TRINITY_DN9208_c0_g2_i1.p1  ORF type:complete len:214 (+),score=22.84 TRINITY_DN9208_c0_g2_i1:79-720(+)